MRAHACKTNELPDFLLSNRWLSVPHAPSDGKAWLEATDPADQLLYGGKWSPVSIRVAITKLEQERDAARDEAAALRRQLATAKSARL